MTRIESKKAELQRPPAEVFAFLSDFHNLGALMPEQVEGFTVEGDTCKFTIKGMTTLGLKYESKTPDREVVMVKHGQGPFELRLICKMEPSAAGGSVLQLVFEADLNPFLKLMAEKPLGNFLNLLVDKYAGMSSGASM